MALILGISAYYHDSAVALVSDGTIIAAASEERFSRQKHDKSFPARALKACLESVGASLEDVDYVGFYEKPLLKFDRLLETHLAYAPTGYRAFAAAMPSWLSKKMFLPREIRKQLRNASLGSGFKKRIIFCEHHESHAASAFFPSPFERAAILTADGVGEWTTTSWGVGSGNRISLRSEMRFPHSLGLLYSAITYFCGFRVNSGEYKLMGLAPYGRPKYCEALEKHVVHILADGSFTLNMEYFDYCAGLRMTSRKFAQMIGCKPRNPKSEIREVDMDLAASIQATVEKILLRIADHIHASTGEKNLCMAGGVALNCVANSKILSQTSFENVWVQPAAGDAGGGLGVALFIWHQLMGKERNVCLPDAQSASLLGPQHDFLTELRELQMQGAQFHQLAENELDETVAGLLADGKVVGWVQGKMEFGPRALGNRSILGDPRCPYMQSRMNQKIKFRESFRPFAPAILAEHANEYFDMPSSNSPYMLFTSSVQESRTMAAKGPSPGLEQIKQVRSDLPAVTHVDYSARVQTVDQEQHPRFHKLLSAFHRRTTCPALINTSFNVRGEPIVHSAADAYRCFMGTEIDALVVSDCIFYRHEQLISEPSLETRQKFPAD